MPKSTPGFMRRVASAVGLLLLVWLGLLTPERGLARLDPYYIVRGDHFVSIRPRVLFVLDSSGSMAWRTQATEAGCVWSGCESDNTSQQSRIYVARKAIKEVVAATSERASYSLMTFDHLPPPTSAATVPESCSGSTNDSCSGYCNWTAPSGCSCSPGCQFTNSCCPDYADECISTSNSCSGRCGSQAPAGCWCDSSCRTYGDCCGDYLNMCSTGSGTTPPASVERFTWVTRHNMTTGGGTTPSSSIPNPAGGTGTWTPCGRNKPYPYLRWDNLLYGYSIANGAAMPSGPLSQYVTASQFSNVANGRRKVQWMPRFLGTRFRFDDCDEGTIERTIVDNSFGDYGNESNSVERADNICGDDFYYWPFVDGFAGYAYTYLDRGPSTTQHLGGVNARAELSRATLFSPFFLQSAHDDSTIPAAQKGPASKEDATELVSGLTSPMTQGGIDAHHDTPWSTAIGNVSNFVSVGGGGQLVDVGVRNSNGAFQHDSVASYLSFVATSTEQDLCVPTVAVVVTDGEPSPGYGGSTLYSNLSKLRRILGVKTYVVGFFTTGSSLQSMACAAAGSQNTSTPCSELVNDYDWDTCRDPGSPTTSCAFLADDAEALVGALKLIVDEAIDSPVPSGPGASLNEFLPDDVVVQTQLSAYTDIPSFRGHVIRGACTLDEEYCENASEPPETREEENFDFDGNDSDSTTNCPFSRNWDAGWCLQRKRWSRRKVYANRSDNSLYRISEDDGTATDTFVSELTELGLVATDGASTAREKADDFAAFILGGQFHEEWKLPGLANSSPVMVRRIPQPDPDRRPEVGIRDPHCAGRRLSQAHSVPASLRTFATEAWELDPANATLRAHYDYQEAVLVGDDLGVLHAFQLDSGNEIFAFTPRTMLPHIARLVANGPSNFGQPAELDEHELGLATTVNQGFVFDEEADTWRHLVVFGLGGGGNEYVAFDAAHMGRVDDDDPIEVLWTTESISDEAYDAGLGETWSHPALTYVVPEDSLGREPKAYVVFGSGYGDGTEEYRGQTLFAVDAVTGDVDTGQVVHFGAPDTPMFEAAANYSLINDPAIGTHCLSRFWGEAQEAYLADIAGRLFRWDLGTNAAGTAFPHTADSGAAWEDLDEAEPLRFGGAGDDDDDDDDGAHTVFRACEGEGDTCSIAATNRGDMFVFSPAVISNNRIDEFLDVDDLTSADKDQFLLALVSGTPFDDAINDNDESSDVFHSSLYMLVDDHRDSARQGLSVPGIGGLVEAAEHSKFARYPLSVIVRHRNWTYPDGTAGHNYRAFSRATRPLRPPRIRVTGLVGEDDEVIEDAEVYYITYTVFEPGDDACDEHWYDPDDNEWKVDPGSTFEITFRLVAFGEFDFSSEVVLPGTFIDGFGDRARLSDPQVVQLRGPECPDGLCGPKLQAGGNRPCDPNDETSTEGGQPLSLPVGWAELDGFSPLEVPLTE